MKLASATLYLRVCDSDGQAFPGNVFVSVTSAETGESWRTLRFRRGPQSFAFTGLPLGRYSYKAWTTPQHTLTGSVELLSPGLHEETAHLGDRSEGERLEIPIAGRLAEMRARMEARDSPIEDLPESSPARILRSLLDDRTLVAATTMPAYELGLREDTWRFLRAVTPGSALGNGPSSTVVARARFLMMTRCAIVNPLLRRGLAPRATDEQSWEAVIRVMRTLDAPGLDDLLIWAARIHRPAVASLETFLRGWAERYDGLCNMRVAITHATRDAVVDPAPDPAIPELPPPAEEDSMVAASAPLLAEMARIAGTCMWQVAA